MLAQSWPQRPRRGEGRPGSGSLLHRAPSASGQQNSPMAAAKEEEREHRTRRVTLLRQEAGSSPPRGQKCWQAGAWDTGRAVAIAGPGVVWGWKTPKTRERGAEQEVWAPAPGPSRTRYQAPHSRDSPASSRSRRGPAPGPAGCSRSSQPVFISQGFVLTRHSVRGPAARRSCCEWRGAARTRRAQGSF